jgi:phosphoribosylformylglycinamidine (FGAM) synthase-like enzyme
VGFVGLRTGMGEDAINPSSGFLAAGHTVALIGAPAGETLGGSEWLFSQHGLTAGRPPQCDLAAEKATSDAVRGLVSGDVVASAHDLSDGGLLVAIAESAACHYGQRFGANLDLEAVLAATGEDLTTAAFGEAGARVLVSYDPTRQDEVAAACVAAGTPLAVLGSTQAGALTIRAAGSVFSYGLDDLFGAWDGGLEAHVGVTV